MSSRWRLLLLTAVSLLLGLAMVVPKLLGFHSLPLPRGPDEPYRLEPYRNTLAASVRGGGVDYDALRTHRDGLLHFVKALATNGPASTPADFPTRPEKLAFYINAYNALVLYGVLGHAPETSVQDVRGFIDVRPGFGFFYGMRLELDGQRTNLYDLENDVLRGFGDPRIHAAISCASASCPPLDPEPYTAADLDARLDRAARAWVASDEHVRIAPEALYLSSIFDWFEEDFEAAGGATTWVAGYLEGQRKAAFEAALGEGRPTRFISYDWSLNRAPVVTSTTTLE